MNPAKATISVRRDRLLVGERFSVSFQRTLRIPDDGGEYPLPPGLGPFPLSAVADHANRVPREWRERGGFFIPMYQREALWLGFDGADWKPNAVKVGIGGIDAISGAAWTADLHAEPQDYVVVPDQPWLDGINAGSGVIRQFVAMPLGAGYTVEGQLTGEERVGGMEIRVFEPRPGIFPDEPLPAREHAGEGAALEMAMAPSMGIAAGGRMTQKIYPDPYGVDTWDRGSAVSISIHIVNSQQYESITGQAPPASPIDARAYTAHGLPWFELYDETRRDVAASERLRGVQSIGELDAQAGRADGSDSPLAVNPDQVRGIDRDRRKR